MVCLSLWTFVIFSAMANAFTYKLCIVRLDWDGVWNKHTHASWRWIDAFNRFWWRFNLVISVCAYYDDFTLGLSFQSLFFFASVRASMIPFWPCACTARSKWLQVLNSNVTNKNIKSTAINWHTSWILSEFVCSIGNKTNSPTALKQLTFCTQSHTFSKSKKKKTETLKWEHCKVISCDGMWN